MKIGILGGSFDPIHKGHLHMAINAYKEYKLDEIWLMPAGHSPNKDEKKMTSAIDRFNMCQIAATEYDYIKASDFELVQDHTSYTYLTLQALRTNYPDNQFYFIMGADSLDYFDKWYHPEIIAQICTILVVIRKGFSEEEIMLKSQKIKNLFPCEIEFVHCDRFDISSTEIRKNLANKIDMRQYIPISVIDYINNNNLYSTE